MTHRDLNKVSSGSDPGRAEVLAAIDLLIEKVAHLALRIDVFVATARAFKAELPGKPVSDVAPHDPIEAVDLREVETAASGCYVQMFEVADAANISLSPPNGSDGASRNEPDALIDSVVKLEVVLLPPDHESCPKENLLAARLVELHDRLGGFIKH